MIHSTLLRSKSALAALLAFLIVSTVNAQVWITWDGSPPGTLPSLELISPKLPPNDPQHAQQTEYQVTLHGFFVEEVIVRGQTYHRIVVPSREFSDDPNFVFDYATSPRLPVDHEIGLPALPHDIQLVGVVTDGDLAIEFVQPTDPNPGAAGESSPFFDLQQINGMPCRPYPAQEAPMDCDCCAEPPFAIDQNFYATHDQFWPPALGEVSPKEGWLTFWTGKSKLNLMQYRPSDTTLRVIKQLRIRVSHLGNILLGPNAPDLSAELEALYKRVVNFQRVKIFFNQLTETRYLIIAHEDFATAIRPLIDAKVAQGVNVTLIKAFNAGPVAAPDILATAADVQGAIQSFYQNSRSIFTPYVLLVGDTDRIPPGGIIRNHVGHRGYTDRPYAQLFPAGINADNVPDLHIGRISGDSGSQIYYQAKKIAKYENRPLNGNWTQNVLLVAAQNGPHDYRANFCGIRNNITGSPNTPSVKLAFGAATGAAAPCPNTPAEGNNFVTTWASDALGVIAYRGHGCATRWAGWSTLNQPDSSFRIGQILSCALQNACLEPPVFSFACWTGQFRTVPAGAPNPCGAAAEDVADGMGETWMQVGPSPIGGGQAQIAARKGGVSHYGAVIGSYTAVNDTQASTLFHSIYRRGITRLSIALMDGEAAGRQNHKGTHPAIMPMTYGEVNTLAYNILGDPHMNIRITPVTGSPAVCCVSDIVPDGTTNVADLLAIISLWGQSPVCDPGTDPTHAGTINTEALLYIISHWGPCP